MGRVANRIGDAQFTLNGTLYKLVANDGKNMLHGMYIFIIHLPFQFCPFHKLSFGL